MLFNNPKPGDEVIYQDRIGNRIVKIDRVTPKQIIVQGLRFSQDDGWQINADKWNRTSIIPADPESALYKSIVTARRLRLLKTRISKFVAEATADDIGTLEKIAAVLSETKTE